MGGNQDAAAGYQALRQDAAPAGKAVIVPVGGVGSIVVILVQDERHQHDAEDRQRRKEQDRDIDRGSLAPGDDAAEEKGKNAAGGSPQAEKCQPRKQVFPEGSYLAQPFLLTK